MCTVPYGRGCFEATAAATCICTGTAAERSRDDRRPFGAELRVHVESLTPEATTFLGKGSQDEDQERRRQRPNVT